MSTFFEKNIYQELGKDIETELKKNHCKIIVNKETVTYTFSGCPDLLLQKMINVKELKGVCSVLNEFRPSQIMKHLKWNMTKRDRQSLIKRFRDYETTFDFLINEQKTIRERLLQNLEGSVK